MVLCGRFEGVDQRVVEARALEEVSLGDIVLSGGEPAAIALIDACVRLLPGVVGRAASLDEESFADLLEYPQFTRPQEWEGRRCRTCCCPAITSASAPGAGARRSAPPDGAARISGRAMSCRQGRDARRPARADRQVRLP